MIRRNTALGMAQIHKSPVARAGFAHPSLSRLTRVESAGTNDFHVIDVGEESNMKNTSTGGGYRRRRRRRGNPVSLGEKGLVGLRIGRAQGIDIRFHLARGGIVAVV